MAYPCPASAPTGERRAFQRQRSGRRPPGRIGGSGADDVRLLPLLRQPWPAAPGIILGKGPLGEPVTLPILGSSPGGLWIGGPRHCGRSELLRTALISIAWQAAPGRAWILAIDPSGLELGMIEQLPHAVLPVVTDARRARALLQWVVDEVAWRWSGGVPLRRIFLAIDGLPLQAEPEPRPWGPTLAWLMRHGPAVGVHPLVTEAGRDGNGAPPASLEGAGIRLAVSAGEPGEFRLQGCGEDRWLRGAWMPVRDLVTCLEAIRRRGGWAIPSQAVSTLGSMV